MVVQLIKHMDVTTLDPQRLARAKKAYTSRHVPTTTLVNLLRGDIHPRPGDLVLAQVTQLNMHKRFELHNGRRARLFVDDEVIVCYGNRYAPDVYEAEVGQDLTECDLIAAGGIAGQMLCKADVAADATRLRPLGLIGDADGRTVNLSDFRLYPLHLPKTTFNVVVLGTAMNSGKTTTAAHLARGMVSAGYKVGAAKVTGTGSGQDVWHMTDAGANPVFDFTDAGHASTYRIAPNDVEDILLTLTSHIQNSNVEITILEVADGIYQRETSLLLDSEIFHANVDAIVFSARDSAGAVAGVKHLTQRGLTVVAVSGVLSSYPLLRREAEEATGLPVMTAAELEQPQMAPSIIGFKESFTPHAAAALIA